MNEVPACEHRFVGQAADGTLRCTYCGHNFGPVRELIEKAGLWNLYGSSAGAAELIATLTRERDEAREHTSLASYMRVERERLAACVTLEFARDKATGLQRDLDAARARIAELERERNTFNEGVWDRAVRSTLERLRDHMNFLEKEVTP